MSLSPAVNVTFNTQGKPRQASIQQKLQVFKSQSVPLYSSSCSIVRCQISTGENDEVPRAAHVARNARSCLLLLCGFSFQIMTRLYNCPRGPHQQKHTIALSTSYTP